MLKNRNSKIIALILGTFILVGAIFLILPSASMDSEVANWTWLNLSKAANWTWIGIGR